MNRHPGKWQQKLRRALRLTLERHVEVEVIGQEECPMMLRWEFLSTKFLKAMIHYFPAEVSDRDPHDHPRPFVTLVLRGNYRDESWQRIAGGYDQYTTQIGRLVKERVHAGAFRYRKAEHLHIVETDEVGCWTLVIMGPIVREWGFVRLSTGLWWEWGKYIQRFGGVARCDAPPDKMGIFTTRDASVIIGGDPAEESPVTGMKITVEDPGPIPLDRTSAHFHVEGDEPMPEQVEPHVGDFVAVADRPELDGKVENVSGETAWIRTALDWSIHTVKVPDLRSPADHADLVSRYYRRAQ